MQAERNSSVEKSRKRMAQRLGGFILTGLALLSVLTEGSAYAQQSTEQGRSETAAAPKTAGAAAINPAKEATIRKLLELTGAKKNAVEFGQQLGGYLRDMLDKGLPPGANTMEIGSTLVKKLTEQLASDELIVRLIPIYDKAFSEEELKEINQFYETAPGRKLLEATPKVMEEASNVSEQWIKELIPHILGQMQEQFPELKEGAK